MNINWLILIAVLTIGLVAPTIGIFLVSKRYSLLADSLAHMALAGVAIGLIMGVYPVYTALVVTVIMAVLMEVLRTKKKINGEAALAMFMSGGLALAVVLSSASGGSESDLEGYLFGDLLALQATDVWFMLVMGFAVVGVVAVFYKELVAIAFDEDLAQVDGLPTTFLNLTLMILTAITVSLAMRVVGVLLTGALMVIPVMTAVQLRRSFKATFGWGILFSLLAVSLGLGIAAQAELVAEVGGVIVLVALGVFLLVLGGKSVVRRVRKN